MKLKGLFVEEIDYDDPSYAQWHIEKLGRLNDAQRNAWMDDDDEVDDPPLTEAEQIELCLKMRCQVELARSNVCTGVERSWPKLMFKKQTFNDLEPKEKRCIYRDMQRKGVSLYNKYVDENRLKQRCRRCTTNAMAPYREVRYRKHLFERLKTLAEPGNSATHEEPVDDDGHSIDELSAHDELIDDGIFIRELTEDDSDDDRLVIDEQTVNESPDASTENSLVTVINSGSIQFEEFNMDNDGDVASGHSNHLQSTEKIPRQTSINKRRPLIAKSNISLQQGFIPDDDDDELVKMSIQIEHNLRDDGSNDVISESFVSSTVPNDIQRSTQGFINTPTITSNDYTQTILRTPDMDLLRNSRRHLIEDDAMPSSQYEEDLEVDTLDFLSQNMHAARTSTQK